MASYEYFDVDFEFSRVSEPRLRMVAAAFTGVEGSGALWLCDHPSNQKKFVRIVEDLRPGTVICSYNVEAEARSFISLGLDPRDYKWHDLYLEYLMLMNHNHEVAYGNHLINGQVKKLRPFVDEKGKASLAGALYKMCGIIIDTAHKDAMRDLIISDPEFYDDEEEKDICDYAISDVKYLKKLRDKITAKILELTGLTYEEYMEDVFRRSSYAVETAWMVTHGYPINVEWAKNLTENVEPLLDACVRDINSQFPGKHIPFSFDPKNFRWKANQANWREWIKDNKLDKDWPLTDGGESGKRNLSLALEAWTDRFDYRHDYPRNNYGAQIVRYLKLKQSLNGFRDKAGKDKKSFWDYVGSDGRVRPYFGIYGAQSSRSQPSATGYVFLKPAWQRTLVHPPKGKMIVGIDYASQEFLLSALFSGDPKMIDAYRSGDVYLAFGKLIGLIPKNGTKATHKFQRDACKATVLGLSYLMSKYGLARKLTADTGRIWTEDEAQEQVEAFDEAFDVFSEYRKNVIDCYMPGPLQEQNYIRLKDGWYMFKDNSNHRSVGNMPIQGAGADIMRRSVEACTLLGLKVIITLHDALYIECDLNDWKAVDKFIASMNQGFTSYFEGTPQYEDSKMIRLDTYAWGDGLKEEEVTTPNGNICSTMPVYVDERAVSEFELYKDFFMENSGVDAL